MNIFVLDKEVRNCARYHCDKHIVKMILESCQMLSTALRLNGQNYGYKVTHANHPCAIWLRESKSNWKWLRKLACELDKEYRFRFRKKEHHKSYDVIKTLPVLKVPDIGLTPFAQAMPIKYKSKNTVLAYRNYYLAEKNNLFNWTRRGAPYWVQMDGVKVMCNPPQIKPSNY